MRISILFVAAIAVVACSKKNNDTPAHKGADPKPPTDAPGSAKPAAKSPADAFVDGKVAFPEPIAKIKFGMPEADVQAAAPMLVAEKFSDLPGYEDLEAFTRFHQGVLSQASVTVPESCDQVKVWLTKKWGAPTELTTSTKKLVQFASPDVELRASLEERAGSKCQLNYARVWSTEQLLGTDPKLFGFEKAPLLGMTQDELVKTYVAKPRAADPTSYLFDLPALVTSEHANHVDARVKDGKVTGYALSIVTGGDAATDAAVVARLEQLFGAGKQAGLYTDFKGPPKVKAEIRKDSAAFPHTIWVGDTKK